VTAGVLLLVAIVLAVFVVPQVRTESRTAQLQTATTAAHQQTRPAVDQRRRTADQVLARILGPAALGSAVVSCRLDEDYAGLMVQNWRQVCTIRTLDVYPTTLSYPALAAQLESAATSGEELLGAASTDPAPRYGCGPVRSYSSPSLRTPSTRINLTRLQADRFNHPDDPAGTTGCSAPPQSYQSTTGATRIEAAFPPEQIDLARSWLVMERDTEFFRKDLGCAGLLACSPPVTSRASPTMRRHTGVVRRVAASRLAMATLPAPTLTFAVTDAVPDAGSSLAP
jgi:type II secretory pathway pseudopilin PulG